MPLRRQHIQRCHRCSPIFAPIPPPHRSLSLYHLHRRHPSLRGCGLEGVGGGARCHPCWPRVHRPDSFPPVVVVLRPQSCRLPSATYTPCTTASFLVVDCFVASPLSCCIAVIRRRFLVIATSSSRHLIIRRWKWQPLSRYVHLISPQQHNLYSCC